MPSRSRNLRWNFRLGPLQFTAPVGAAGLSFLVALVLLCCGAGVIGTLTDDDPAPAPTSPATAPAPGQPTGPLVTAGEVCDKSGAAGVTEAGERMVCTGEGDLRWRRP